MRPSRIIIRRGLIQPNEDRIEIRPQGGEQWVFAKLEGSQALAGKGASGKGKSKNK